MIQLLIQNLNLYGIYHVFFKYVSFRTQLNQRDLKFMQPGGETVVEVEGEVGVVGGYSEPGSLKQMKDRN